MDFLGKACRAATSDGAKAFGKSRRYWERLAAESWPAGGKNEYVHLQRSEFSDHVDRLPEGMAIGPEPGQEGGDDIEIDPEAHQLLMEAGALLAVARRSDEQERRLQEIRAALPWLHRFEGRIFGAADDEED